MSLAVFMGCSEAPEDPVQTQSKAREISNGIADIIDDAAEASSQTRDAFRKSLDRQLKVADEEIVRLQEKGRDLDAQARTALDEKIERLKVRRDAAAAKLDELSGASEEAWKDLRKGAQQTWDDLESAVHEAAR